MKLRLPLLGPSYGVFRYVEVERERVEGSLVTYFVPTGLRLSLGKRMIRAGRTVEVDHGVISLSLFAKMCVHLYDAPVQT
jgi:hypothetical protein